MKTTYRLFALASAAILLSLSSTKQICAQESLVEKPPATTGAARLTTCSPDGKFFVVATAQGRLTYGRTSDGATLRTFYQCQPKAVAFSKDARLLASVSAKNGSPAGIKVWNLDNGKLLCQMVTEGGRNPLLGFSPDGLLLASTSGGSNVDFWQLPQGTLRCSVPALQAISSIAFSDDGDAVMIKGSDGKTMSIAVP